MPWFVPLILLAVSFALVPLLTRVPPRNPATLEEFDFPQADEGTPKGIMFGDGWIKGFHVPWYGNLRTEKIKRGKK